MIVTGWWWARICSCIRDDICHTICTHTHHLTQHTPCSHENVISTTSAISEHNSNHNNWRHKLISNILKRINSMLQQLVFTIKDWTAWLIFCLDITLGMIRRVRWQHARWLSYFSSRCRWSQSLLLIHCSERSTTTTACTTHCYAHTHTQCQHSPFTSTQTFQGSSPRLVCLA